MASMIGVDAMMEVFRCIGMLVLLAILANLWVNRLPLYHS